MAIIRRVNKLFVVMICREAASKRGIDVPLLAGGGAGWLAAWNLASPGRLEGGEFGWTVTLTLTCEPSSR